jgi:hypothetical protein
VHDREEMHDTARRVLHLDATGVGTLRTAKRREFAAMALEADTARIRHATIADNKGREHKGGA